MIKLISVYLQFVLMVCLKIPKLDSANYYRYRQQFGNFSMINYRCSWLLCLQNELHYNWN